MEKDIFIGQQNSIETRRMYKRWIDQFDSVVQKHWSKVTDEDVTKFREFVDAQTYAASTKVIAWKAPKSFYSWLVRSGRLNRSPFDAVVGFKKVRDQRPRIPTDEEAKKILEAIQPVSPSEWRERAAVYLCANGLRISEIATLRTSDYFHDGNTPLVRVLGKGGRERLVPLAAPVKNALDDWRMHDEVIGSEYLLHEYNGNPISSRQVRSAMDKALDRVLEKDRRIDPRARRLNVSAHSLRHHYATRLIRAGANVFSVMKLLGHSDVSTTQVYVNLDTKDIIEAAGKDPLNG